MGRSSATKPLLIETPWPKADPALLVDNTVTIAVQVNGKLRATITLAARHCRQGCRSGRPGRRNVKRAIDGKSAKKIIVVPNKIINVVA